MKRDNSKTPPVGVCPVCDINLYADKGNKPDIMPCGIHRGGKEDCPYETAGEYIAHMRRQKAIRSSTGTGLAMID
jgi:hypothetical protein